MEVNKTINCWKIPTTKITVEIIPYLFLGYKVHTLQLFESIGGNISRGELVIELTTDIREDTKDMAAIYDWDIVEIKIDDGQTDVSYDIFGWVMSRESIPNDCIKITFYVYPLKEGEPFKNREFFTCPQVTCYPTYKQPKQLNNIIQQLWNGDKAFEIRCESDLTELPSYIWQRNETNCQLLTKILYSYKKNSIFGYSLSGGFIKDIIGKDWMNRTEPCVMQVGQHESEQSTGLSRNTEYLLHQKFQDPWENIDSTQHPGSDKSTNIIISTVDGYRYLYTTQEWNQMQTNYRFNKKNLDTSFYSSLEINTPNQLPRFKLGDTIVYTHIKDGSKNKEKIFMVSSNQFYIAAPDVEDTDQWGNKFSVTSVLRGLEENHSSMFPTDKYPDLEELDVFKAGIIN